MLGEVAFGAWKSNAGKIIEFGAFGDRLEVGFGKKLEDCVDV